jgi:HD-GYP domain-containing protein (c-di-GMP phosphodiesterase class II)/Tfp pilus assembly protein PilF
MTAALYLTSPEDIIMMLESALELSKSEPDRALLKVTEAVQNTEASLAAQSLLELGRACYQQNQLAQALTAFQEAFGYAIHSSEQAITLEILLSLGRTQRDLGQFESAIQHLNQALELSQKMKCPEEEVEALILLAVISNFQGFYTTALKYLKDSLVIAEKHQYHEKIGRIFNNMGINYCFLSIYDEALEALGKANRLCHQFMPQSRYEGFNLIALGQVYAAMDDTKNALDFYEQAQNLGDLINDSIVQVAAINNLAELYLKTQNLDRAKNGYKKALTIARSQNLKQHEFYNIYGLAQVHCALGLYQQALSYYFEALAISKEIGDSQGEVDTLLQLVHTYILTEQTSKALELLLNIQDMNLSNYPKANCEVHELLARAYEQTKDFETALFHYQQFHTLKSKLTNEENSHKTRELSIQFEVEQAHRQADDNRIRTELEQKARAEAESNVRERTKDLENAQLEIVNRLAVAGEYRDDETGEHTRRVGRNAAVIAYLLGWGMEEIQLIYSAARLHDVGKMGIRDAILLKPAKLTPEEMDVMRSHSTMGAQILAGGTSRLLRLAEEIALYHHERWDGTGYPHGISGVEIPISARIVAVADVFDALTHERPYKKAWSVAEALAEIQKQSDHHFDPIVVAACVKAFNPHNIMPLTDDLTGWDNLAYTLENLLFF